MDRNPAAYETNYTTQTVTIEQTPVTNLAFVRSLSGILKIAEILLSIIVLICAATAPGWSLDSSGGWVNFVAAITLVCSGLFFIFYFFNLIRKLPGRWVIIEFSVLVISAFFWLITLIVASSKHYFGGGAIATAIFSAVAVAVYITELVTRFRVQRSSGQFVITMTGVATPTVQSTVPATTTHITHTAPGTADPRIGFSGAYAQGERADEGYVMP